MVGPALTSAGAAARRLAFLFSLGTAIACGSGGTAPTSPTPQTPTTDVPSANACDTLGLTSSAMILNGAECPTGSTAIVLLNMRDRRNFAVGACSGTVISDRAILTAAHCLKDEVETVRVFLGSGLQLTAAAFARHPAYQGNVINDVGVVLMSEPIGRRPIPLLLGRDARVGETAVIAGWGRNQNDVPATFRAGTTVITAIGPVLETTFGPNVSSICSGDSGGPILLSENGVWSIAGVTSATSENICNTGTNFYVSVRNPAISSFILDRVPDAAR